MTDTPYTNGYRKQMNEKFSKKWPQPFKIEDRINSIEQKIKEEVKEDVSKIEDEIKEDYKEVKDFIKEPRHIKILKIIALLIPLIIIGYLIYNNFLISQEFNYFYDIGSSEDAKKPYLSPLSRVSGISSESDVNYRNLTDGLVYFNIPIARNSESVNIQTKFTDNFPNQSKMLLGAKDQQIWHYLWNPIYNPSLNDLSGFEKIDNFYLINPNLSLDSFDELISKENIVIATDKHYTPSTNIIKDYNKTKTIINASLRGGHVFYIYTSGDLNLEVKKQDINWYNGSDELEISLYNAKDNLIANTTIMDDGIIGVSKDKAEIQSVSLDVSNLSEGVYKLELSDFDGLIREIKINTNKIVSNKLFLADSSLYNGIETKPSKIYAKLYNSRQLELRTWHNDGVQNVSYNNNSVYFNKIKEPYYLSLYPGENFLYFPKNDLMISGPVYFAFSEENYFEPFNQIVISIPSDVNYIKKNVDCLVTDYSSLIRLENKWLVSETSFNIKEDKLFIKDSKLSVVFNAPHLGQEDLKEFTIPIDWINITVYKPGLIEKYDLNWNDLKFWSREND